MATGPPTKTGFSKKSHANANKNCQNTLTSYVNGKHITRAIHWNFWFWGFLG